MTGVHAGGFTDPSLTERIGLPLVEPFGEELLEMRGWAYWSHWIGCGHFASRESARSDIVVASTVGKAVGAVVDNKEPERLSQAVRKLSGTSPHWQAVWEVLSRR